MVLVYVGISAGSMYAAGNLDDGLNIINNPIIPHWNGTKIIELPDFGEAIKIVDGQAVYVEDDCPGLLRTASSPSKIWIWSPPYSFSVPIYSSILHIKKYVQCNYISFLSSTVPCTTLNILLI